MRLIKNPDEARRLARTILSDILLYNEAKVKEGIEREVLPSHCRNLWHCAIPVCEQLCRRRP